jgi:heme exporter protein B
VIPDHSKAGADANWLKQAWTICLKDVSVEVRERTGISSLMLFAVTSLVVVGFALTGGDLDTSVASALLWVVLFFATFSGLGHSFAVEEETGSAMLLRLAARPEAVLAGKCLANLLVLSLVSVVAVPLFLAITGLSIPAPSRLTAVVISGIVALSASATVTAAVVAKARARGVLFGALGFPIVMPLLIMAVVATRHAVSGFADDWSWVRDVGGLIAYAVMVVAASVLIFPTVWETQ